MALHVTQCPSCESSFNTNAQLLEAAAGKVRCGSCLIVFNASEHFVESANDGDESGLDSVFVGNDPNAFFDPTKFLTRRSLQEASDSPIDGESIDRSSPELSPGVPPFESTIKTPASDNGLPKETSGPNIDGGSEELDGSHSSDLHESENAAPSLKPEDMTLAVSFSLQHAKVNRPPKIAAESSDKKSSAEFKADIAETNLSVSIGEGAVAATSEEIQPKTGIQFDSQNQDASTPLNTSVGTVDPESKTEEVSGPELKSNSSLDTAAEDGSIQNELWNSDKEKQEALAALAEADYTLLVNEVITEVSLDGEQPPLETGTESPYAAGIIQDDIDEELLAQPESGFELEPDIEETQPAKTDSHSTQENEPKSELSTEEIRARALEAELEDDDALEVIPQLDLDTLGQMSAPVDLGSAKRKHWGTTAALGLASVLLGCTLAGQYFWRNLPLYSQLEQFRPAYIFVCSYVGCELPPYSNIDAIVSDELNIRSHPSESNALAVNISFRNTADLAQRFPVIILSFNSSQNEIVALREFSPAEYLSEGLQEIDEMPPGAPVQIELAIMDPGPFAVNYTLAFRNL